MTNRSRAEELAAQHEGACPSPPPPRHGATTECGCWTYDAMPGQTLGDRVVCPEHGDTRFAAMNVGCPQPDPGGRWIAASPDPESETP